MEFFKLLAFYIASNTLSSIYWAVPFGPSDLDTMMKQAQDVMTWFDNMQNPVPTWYLAKYELWDVYDKDRNKTGRLHERGKPMATGDYHIIVHVWKRNTKGEWLIDKRAPRCSISKSDGLWEMTGGCALAGDDSLAAALRETKEELGIDLNPQSGELFSTTAHQWEDGHTAFVDVWVFDCDIPIENIAFSQREVTGVMWAAADEIKTMIASGEFLDCCPYFDEMVKWKAAKI
jgi:8-oxo-dGTP pyrophosphatase MutT (NUDIX family)